VEEFSPGISIFIEPLIVLIIAFQKALNVMEESKSRLDESGLGDKDFDNLHKQFHKLDVQDGGADSQASASGGDDGDDPNDPDYDPAEDEEDEPDREPQPARVNPSPTITAQLPKRPRYSTETPPKPHQSLSRFHGARPFRRRESELLAYHPLHLLSFPNAVDYVRNLRYLPGRDALHSSVSNHPMLRKGPSTLRVRVLVLFSPPLGGVFLPSSSPISLITSPPYFISLQAPPFFLSIA
jgi:hypothetical protein